MIKNAQLLKHNLKKAALMAATAMSTSTPSTASTEQHTREPTENTENTSTEQTFEILENYPLANLSTVIIPDIQYDDRNNAFIYENPNGSKDEIKINKEITKAMARLERKKHKLQEQLSLSGQNTNPIFSDLIKKNIER